MVLKNTILQYSETNIDKKVASVFFWWSLESSFSAETFLFYASNIHAVDEVSLNILMFKIFLSSILYLLPVLFFKISIKILSFFSGDYFYCDFPQ